jgi:hypothetical protein
LFSQIIIQLEHFLTDFVLFRQNDFIKGNVIGRLGFNPILGSLTVEREWIFSVSLADLSLGIKIVFVIEELDDLHLPHEPDYNVVPFGSFLFNNLKEEWHKSFELAIDYLQSILRSFCQDLIYDLNIIIA